VNNYNEDDHSEPFENTEGSRKVAKVAKVAGGVPESPLPLYPQLIPSKSYPVSALGETMGKAASAIVSKCFVSPPIASQSILAAACLAVQGHVDVELLSGQSRPCSLYLITVARSGDRKSTADNEASEGIRRHEQSCEQIYKVQCAEWQLEHDIWTSKKAKLKAATSGDSDAKLQTQLKSLGPEPKKPLLPVVQLPDPTIEGLVKNWVELPGSIGIFSAEGGQFIGGYSMAAEPRVGSAAALSTFWDGTPYRRIRAGDPPLLLAGRRLCIHLMIQPEIAATFLSDRSMRDQGLLSRLNIASPESLAGQRLYRPSNSTDQGHIKIFNDKVFGILQKTPPLAGKAENELKPRVLTISQPGKEKLIEFSDSVEAKLAKGGSFEHVQDVGAKAMENACRIAAVLAAFDDIECDVITEDYITRAIEIAKWYLDEAARLADNQVTDPIVLMAQKLLDWLHNQGKETFSIHDILNRGPSPLRTKKALTPVLKVLIEHNWITESSDRPKIFRLNREG